MPKPLSIGRTGRLIFGAASLFYFTWLVIQRDALVGSGIPEPWWWVGFFFAFYYLPDLLVVGLALPWGRWPQVAGALIGVALVVADVVVYGSAWAPPLGWGVFVLSTFFFGLVGVAFLLAAALAVPG